MKLFLVRHAVGGHQRDKWQTPKSKLGKIGLEQSKLLAKRSRFKSVDLIVTSNWKRARETAEVIADELKKPLEIYQGIHEIEQYSEIYGADYNSGISRKLYSESLKNYLNLDWRFKDKGESYREVIKRAQDFQRYLLKKYNKQTLLIVSHDIFIRCFLSLCLLGSKYDDKTFRRVFSTLTITNTGISFIEYMDKWKMWKLWYLNDFSHLKGMKEKRN